MGKDHYNRRSIIACHLFLMFLCGVLILVPWDIFDSQRYSVYCYCVFAAALIPWMFWSWTAYNGSLFDPYTLCLAPAILFSLSYCVLYVFEMAGDAFLNGRFEYELCIQTVGAATVGIMSMHLGALLSCHIRMRLPVSGICSNVSSHGASIVGGILLALATVPALIQMSRIVTFGMSNAYASAQEPVGTGINASVRILATFMGPATFYFLVGRPRSRARIVIAATFAILNCSTLLFFGDRSDATMMLVAFLWLYERSVKRIPRTSLVAGIAVLITLYPLIRINRALTGIERLSPSVWVEALSRTDNPVRSSIAEMGGSLGVLAHVINLVPDARPFDYGGSYFWAITSIFPNVSGGLHPSAQRSLSTWLINTIDPSGAERGGGAGFSFLAEAYLNFGWYGVVGIPMLIGATLSIVTRWSASTRTPAGWAAVACMLEIMPKFARSEALEQVRWIAWVCVGLYLTCRLLERRKMRGIFIAHIRPRLIFYSPDCKSNN